MVMAHEEQATLPWGVTRPPVGTAPTEPRPLPVGTKIEVLWEVVDDDGGEPTTKWWEATVEQGKDRTAVGSSEIVIRYAASSEDGFDDAETRPVIIRTDHELYDPEEEEVLLWRVAGDGWEPAPEDTDSGGETTEDEEDLAGARDGISTGHAASRRAGGRAPGGETGVVTLSELSAAISARETATGMSVEDACAAALGDVPLAMRGHVAAGFRDFSEALRGRFAEVAAARGEGATLTAEDIRAITRDVGAELQRGGGR